MRYETRHLSTVIWLGLGLLAVPCVTTCSGQTITPSPYWKNQITLPAEPFASFPVAGLRWIKFTILTPPYDPAAVYFQHTGRFPLHHQFATNYLDPFLHMSSQQFYESVLTTEVPPAILGTVLIAPDPINEYAIQFVRYDRETIRDAFEHVRLSTKAQDEAEVFFFPTFAQQALAEIDRDWFADHGITLGNASRWAQGNSCYAQGWALGRLRYIPADQIHAAYRSNQLQAEDILLTDGIPAEIPAVAGVITLSPSTPNSHVAILSRTYGTPFLYLALPTDATRAQQLIGRRILLSAFETNSGACETQLIDTEDAMEDSLVSMILARKVPPRLNIQPMKPYGAIGTSAEELAPMDTRYFGGKAAHFGLLRQSIPHNSPRALALSFDLWRSFLDQALPFHPRLALAPGDHLLIWADGDDHQGADHTNFKLNKQGEALYLIDRDGLSLLDSITFDSQQPDISYGRLDDGSDTWQPFTHPTPGHANGNPLTSPRGGLVINEIMADNIHTAADPCEPNEYPDWIELYNASDRAIELNGLFLTDDLNEPSKWGFPRVLTGDTLRDEISQRLAPFQTYPPADIHPLWEELSFIRRLFQQPSLTSFSQAMQTDVMTFLTNPRSGFKPDTRLRFRSSTNVEDSDDYTGAGLYDSYSASLHTTPDPELFRAIRRTMASFYNDNAYLERLRRNVNEEEVGMGLLVHPSFPDPYELANGVATVQWLPQETMWQCKLVTQSGATSVTNPNNDSRPEEVLILARTDRSLMAPTRSGSLSPLRAKSINGIQAYASSVPLGATVMRWTEDYSTLVNLLLDVSERFQAVTDKTEYILDMEYKWVAPGIHNLEEPTLMIKQVRQIPEQDKTARMTPFLVGEPAAYEIFTGEFQENQIDVDVFATHRLKSSWTLTPRNMPLDVNHLTEALYDSIQVELIDSDAHPVRRHVTPSHQLQDGSSVVNQWTASVHNIPCVFQLQTEGIPLQVSLDQSPFFTPRDLGTVAYTPARVLTLQVTYESPVPAWTQSGLTTKAQNTVHLWPRLEPCTDDLPQKRSVRLHDILIETHFYWPASSHFGLPAWNYSSTAPLARFDHTTIQGLTTEPITLVGYYAQTYRPGHHNLVEHFLFEPQQDPHISSAQKAELQQQNIHLIHMTVLREAPENHTGTIEFHSL